VRRKVLVLRERTNTICKAASCDRVPKSTDHAVCAIVNISSRCWRSGASRHNCSSAKGSCGRRSFLQGESFRFPTMPSRSILTIYCHFSRSPGPARCEPRHETIDLQFDELVGIERLNSAKDVSGVSYAEACADYSGTYSCLSVADLFNPTAKRRWPVTNIYPYSGFNKVVWEVMQRTWPGIYFRLCRIQSFNQ
jgi:hypothetical protein